MQVDEVSFLCFSLIILANPRSRTTTGTAGKRRVGAAQGVMILRSDIHAASVAAINDMGIETLTHPERLLGPGTPHKD